MWYMKQTTRARNINNQKRWIESVSVRHKINEGNHVIHETDSQSSQRETSKRWIESGFESWAACRTSFTIHSQCLVVFPSGFSSSLRRARNCSDRNCLIMPTGLARTCSGWCKINGFTFFSIHLLLVNRQILNNKKAGWQSCGRHADDAQTRASPNMINLITSNMCITSIVRRLNR